MPLPSSSRLKLVRLHRPAMLPRLIEFRACVLCGAPFLYSSRLLCWMHTAMLRGAVPQAIADDADTERRAIDGALSQP